VVTAARLRRELIGAVGARADLRYRSPGVPVYARWAGAMDLEELRAFLHVVDAGSFLAGADALGISRSTLRRRVDALEARVGVRLLESTKQGIVLTDAGRVIAGRGRALHAEATALVQTAREVSEVPSGVMRVLLPVGLPPHALVPIVAGMRMAYPTVSFVGRFSDDPIGESLSGVDLAVHFSDGPPKGRFVSYELLRVREWLVASRDYLARRGTRASIADLPRHDLLAWQAPGEDAHQWPLLTGKTFRVDPVLIGTDIHLMRQGALAGLGIALVPDAMMADPGFPPDALAPVLPDVVGRERGLRLTVPEMIAEVPKIKMVLDRVRAFIAGGG
jgi:DNA-binding transcriptional LysR family regulator